MTTTVPIPQGAQIDDGGNMPPATPPAGSKVAIPQGAQVADAEPETPRGLQPYDAGSHGRFTTPENYEKWAKTPPTIGPESKPGEYEAWMGAHQSPADTLETTATVLGEAGLAASVALGPGAIADAGPAALAAKTFLLKTLAEKTPELFGHEAVKATLKRLALEGVKKTIMGGAAGGGFAAGAKILHSIWEDVFGN